MVRRSHYSLVKSALEQSAIVLPEGLHAPQARHEREMIAALDGMIREGRRTARANPAPRRADRVVGTVH